MQALAQLGYLFFTHKQPADLKTMYHQSLLQKGSLRTMLFRPTGEISCFKASAEISISHGQSPSTFSPLTLCKQGR